MDRDLKRKTGPPQPIALTNYCRVEHLTKNILNQNQVKLIPKVVNVTRKTRTRPELQGTVNQKKTIRYRPKLKPEQIKICYTLTLKCTNPIRQQPKQKTHPRV